jgi:enamine deaminase RidA (YjgF/YER057c/UK114 family)
MAERRNISSGTKWEPLVGYSRVVRVGNIVHVAGTTATDDAGNLVGADDAYAQAHYILGKIERYLHAAGAEMRHVVRTRIYATDAALWQDIGRAHHEYFKAVLPVNTLVVAQLIGDAYLVEIEAEAIIHDEV